MAPRCVNIGVYAVITLSYRPGLHIQYCVVKWGGIKKDIGLVNDLALEINLYWID
jgi:hypothetical protein